MTESITKKKKFQIISTIIVVSVVLDQVSKIWIRSSYSRGEGTNLIGDYLRLIYVENTGAFLGLGSSSSLPSWLHATLMLILPVALLVGVSWYLIKTKQIDKLSIYAFSLVLGGGIGNLLDRLIRGSVTDFLFIDIQVAHTGIFNVADMCITAAVIILIINSFKKGKKNTEEEQSNG